MTIREKALESLIIKEAWEQRNKLIEEYAKKLDDLHESIKRYQRAEIAEEYANTLNKLSKLKNVRNPEELLELDYDEIKSVL